MENVILEKVEKGIENLDYLYDSVVKWLEPDKFDPVKDQRKEVLKWCDITLRLIELEDRVVRGLKGGLRTVPWKPWENGMGWSVREDFWPDMAKKLKEGGHTKEKLMKHKDGFYYYLFYPGEGDFSFIQRVKQEAVREGKIHWPNSGGIKKNGS